MINTVLEDEEQTEIALLQCKATLNNVVAITWEKVQEATFDEYGDLLAYLARRAKRARHRDLQSTRRFACIP